MRPSFVPSKDVLRYLRCQSDRAFSPIATAPCHSISHCPRSRRQYTSTTSQRSRNTTNTIDELWHRHRDACKALPPPKTPPQPSNSRNISSSAQNSGWLRRLFRARQHAIKSKSSTDQNGLPFDNQSYEDTSAQLFNLSRALSRNPSGADLKLRCTEFDANGSVTLVAGEFKKTDLIAKYGLQSRDLRKIDSSVLPHILVRQSSILINLLHLRVLIQSDRVLVFDAYGSTDSYTQSLFIDPRSPNSSYLPYEFRALEAVLISVTSGLEAEFALVRDPVTHILRELEEDIDREKLRHLLIHSKKLGTFEQKARLVRDAIEDLLNADDDLAAMYLTKKRELAQQTSVNTTTAASASTSTATSTSSSTNAATHEPEEDHQEVEMLLESYHKICDEIVEISGNLISNIRNTEEVVKAILDANRNQLMLLEIKFSVGTLGLAGGTLVAGLYGMNLNNFIEETDWGFGAVSAVCFGLSAIVCVEGMRRLRKVQKVRMWGEGPWSHNANGGRHGGFIADRAGHQPQHNRGNWRSEAMEAAAMARHGRHQQERVLWPGMDGLGMHRLPEAGMENGGDVSTASGVAPSIKSERHQATGAHAAKVAARTAGRRK
ncbi:Mitochondrial inner membrane magnesium transporter mrs2 [Cyphellophora attinorum]|uniref:Magnesium transporter n=1 Tax=Cyphellophora attinorum TaxID=1664694 RepID=A0A0N1HBN3_9EURO|nr:Mitochondrial inner membrane magnesium transporter mrs2 [Phialophora attinorum]KPI41495.1 Mitochondrial inner membrane magnesium transporter mrs2 [Phialophora attinorum]